MKIDFDLEVEIEKLKLPLEKENMDLMVKWIIKKNKSGVPQYLSSDKFKFDGELHQADIKFKFR